MKHNFDAGQWLTARWAGAWTSWIVVALTISLCWMPVADAASLDHRHLHFQPKPHATRALLPRDKIGNGVDLRVLPIGDSITWGAESSDSNGYRKTLYNNLLARGNKVDFVGGVQSGDSPDPDHEGHRGYLIAEITAASGIGIYSAPNVALLHAGTNDINRNIDVSTAPDRVSDMMEAIWKVNDDAVIILCQIIYTKTATTNVRVKTFNSAIAKVATKYISQGKKVVLVPMMDKLGPEDMAAGGAGDLHPNDQGYINMANAFYDAIETAGNKGWIKKPGKEQVPPVGTSPELCEESPSWYHQGVIADGAHVATDDGPFKPVWVKRGVIATGACPRERLHFADLDGDGLKDYLCVNPTNGSVDAQLNIPDANGKSQNKWNPVGIVATGASGRHGTGVLFGDLDGDGRDDYIYVDPANGDVYGWINQKNGNAWNWQPLGKIAEGVGATNDTLQMVDIDGDGRADFCLADRKTGQVQGWLNTGAALMPKYYKLGVIGTGESQGDGDRVVLGDFTGEGRADYMSIGAGGKVNGLVNRLQENTVTPAWDPFFTLAEGPDGAKADDVRLVDMTGDGKIDYLLVDDKGKTTLYENMGTGGKYQRGEGTILCDLDGDGITDYFWLSETGKGHGYLYNGQGGNIWKDIGEIAKGDHDRNQVRMAPLTTTGRADYIVVDDLTGKAVWYQNMGPSDDWSWGPAQVAAAGPVKTITDKYGWRFRGKNVRFADLTGDGLADYLYVNDNGAVVMWKNLGTSPISWGPPALVADGPSPMVLARQVQFADTNGDGLADYNVVGSITGATRSWHNEKILQDGSIQWTIPYSFADGTNPGASIRLADMTGDKRADYVSVDPATGRLNLWVNRCKATGQPGTGDPSPGDDLPVPISEWCKTVDPGSEVETIKVWDDWGVGAHMDLMLSQVYSPPNLNWMSRMYAEAYPQAGDPNIDGCGVIDGNCRPVLNCTDMASRGYGYHYFALDAAVKMHDHMTALHELFQDSTTDVILSTPAIYDDFAKIQRGENPLGWLGIASYLVGSLAGVATLPRAAAETTRLFFSYASATTYLLGSVANTANKAVGAPGELDPDQLTNELHDMFEVYRTELVNSLALAVGNPGDYSSLPAQGLVQGVKPKSPIAGFFATGRWLLGGYAYNEATKGTFQFFKTKLVDLALAGGGHQVLSDTTITSKSDCVNQPGALWFDDIEGGICLRLFKYYPDRVGCNYNGNPETPDMPFEYLCTMVGETQDTVDKIQKTYNIDLETYYRATYDCAKHGNSDKTPDPNALPEDGSVPTCFYSLDTKKATFHGVLGGKVHDQEIDYENF